MNLRTLNLLVSTPRDTVFNFLADIENLPRWAPSLCERLYLFGGRWMTLSRQGELPVELETEARSGVIDLHAGTGRKDSAVLPLRVLAVAEGSTLISVTYLPAPEWPAGVMQCDADAFEGDLEALVRRFGGGEVCAPAPLPQLAELGVN